MGRPPMLRGFSPQVPGGEEFGSLMLHYDEYEALRLCDYEGLSQLEAARQMHVSRPTFTRIYDGALKKIAKAFVEYKEIKIGGGNVQFEQHWYYCRHCRSSFRSADQKEPLQCPVCHSLDFLAYGKDYDHPVEKIPVATDSWCICPSCGKKEPHAPGIPCREHTCAECGISMIREGSAQFKFIEKTINAKKYQQMKIAIPSKSDQISSEMDAHFGRCAYFAIYDKTNGKTEFHKNPASELQGGAGPKAVEFIAGLGARRVYSRDFGPKAKAALNAVGLEMIDVQDDGLSIEDVIQKIK